MSCSIVFPAAYRCTERMVSDALRHFETQKEDE